MNFTLVGLVQTTWKNRYLVENLEGHLGSITNGLTVGLCLEQSATVRRGVRSPHKLRQRLGVRERRAMVKYYREGSSSREVARRFGLSKTSVLHVLREEGVQFRPRHDKRTKRITD